MEQTGSPLTHKLVHHVVVEGWDHVARVLKLFKRKLHIGFHFEIEELSETKYKRGSREKVILYRVKVFKDPE